MQADLHVNMEEMAREMKLLEKSIATNIRRNLRKAVTESGAEITAAIKSEASWSKGSTHKNQPGRTSIPAATSLAVSFGAKRVTVRVKTSARKAPHARPLEFGNAKGNGNLFRHPVFHSRNEPGGWANQPMRPFFFAAAKAMTPLVERKIQTAIDAIAFEAGFKGR